MIICLRSAGDDFVAGQVKRSSHDEQPAGKAKICFIFHCICLRATGTPCVPQDPTYSTIVQFSTVLYLSSTAWLYLSSSYSFKITCRKYSCFCSTLAITCTIESQQEGDLWGKAVVFWHMERKRERARGQDGGGKMKMPALLLGLWCLILSYSTGESAAQIKLLKAHVHTLFKSLPHIFSIHDTPRQTFLLKGIKLLCGAAGGMHHSVFHLIWCNISQDVISLKVFYKKSK